MPVLLGIAFKSLLIAGVTLGLLQMMKSRSAAERSWIAHIGLFALVVMAFAPLVLPTWNIETPALFSQAPEPAPVVQSTLPSSAVATSPAVAPTFKSSPKSHAAVALPSLNAVQMTMVVYALPAAILLFITFLALARLIALRARADVLVDGHWLSALARAQRRMGFKHGTALLTSDELASPISWGLMRPVILLNSRAVEAAGEAEAIIAHELAHVARMDWMKLLLARIATALFWFNPLVWVLAREAHQLREETADDTVLAADIPDTDYAELLVGVARHECPGLLLGAHGVAPSKGSLARRVARVLDGKSVRGPVARSFATGVFVGAIAIAAPLAALNLTPKGTSAAANGQRAGKPLAATGIASAFSPASPIPADLPHIISQGVTASVATAVAAIGPQPKVVADVDDEDDYEAVAPSGASVRTKNGITVATAPNGATVTAYPADAKGRRKVVARSQTGATAVSYVDADDDIPGIPPTHRGKKDSLLERAIEMKAVGATPEYISAIQAAAPRTRGADAEDFVEMKAVGVTPDYVRDLAAAGFGNLAADELTQARAVGVTGSYVREMRAIGLGGTLDEFVDMRAVGVTPAYADQFRRAGYKISVKKIVDLRANGVDLQDLRDAASIPPAPPPPPRLRTRHDDGEG